MRLLTRLLQYYFKTFKILESLPRTLKNRDFLKDIFFRDINKLFYQEMIFMNKNIEIERKFLVRDIPFNLENFKFSFIKQGYLSTNPVMRLRQKDDSYIFTFKGEGRIKRVEFEYPLTFQQFSDLWKKIEGKEIIKKRYFIPLKDSGFTAELDIYEGEFMGFRNVEVEFPSEELALNFIPPEWFGEDISLDSKYTNSSMSNFGLDFKK